MFHQLHLVVHNMVYFLMLKEEHNETIKKQETPQANYVRTTWRSHTISDAMAMVEAW